MQSVGRSTTTTLNLNTNVKLCCSFGKKFFAMASFKVTRPSYFVRVPSYFEALWPPHLYFDRKSNI